MTSSRFNIFWLHSMIKFMVALTVSFILPAMKKIAAASFMHRYLLSEMFRGRRSCRASRYVHALKLALMKRCCRYLRVIFLLATAVQTNGKGCGSAIAY